jgi:hypothetical protein
MNPFLEQPDTWEDFHNTYISHAREILHRQIGPSYIVKVEVRLYLHELPAEQRRYIGRADVGLAVPGAESVSPSATSTITAPVELFLPAVAVEEERQAFLEIRDRLSRRLITVIELLSPPNKTGPDRDDYLRKRRLLLRGGTHLVEIDLHRGGQRPTPPDLPPCTYYVLVSRAPRRPLLEMWPIGLRERLPVVPIPLAAPETDVLLDLQTLLHEVYDAAGYGRYIYTEKPDPPLNPEDDAWAQQLLTQMA